MIIKTVDALAGSGKTFAAGKYSARTARLGHKTLFVQPTKDLISETIKDIRKHSPDIRLTAIHSGTTENVLATIVQHTREASEHQGEILFITHASFLRLPYFHNAAEWHVIVDEVFQADQGFDFNMPYTHGLITRAFEVVPHNAEYGRVIPSDLSYLDTVSAEPAR
jgi:predicted amidohydrolase YtcJ